MHICTHTVANMCSLHENLFLFASPEKNESKMRHKHRDGMKQNHLAQTVQTQYTTSSSSTYTYTMLHKNVSWHLQLYATLYTSG